MLNKLSPLKSISPFTGGRLSTADEMLAVFSTGVRGVWDMTDKSTMFQDTAGTVPVTASGQPVGRVNDISGNSTHLLQSVAGARPVYTEDANGNHLKFDGVDDALNLSIALESATATCGLALTPIGNSAAAIVVDFNTAVTNTPRSFEVRIPTSAAGNNARARHTGPTGYTDAAAITGGIIGVPTVMLNRHDLSTPRVSTRVNSSRYAVSGVVVGAAPFGTANLRLGRSGTGSLAFNGRMYGACVVNRWVLDWEALVVEEWLNSKVLAWL